MNFIRLTNKHGGVAYVNMDLVQVYEDFEGGSKLHVGKDDYATVKETPSQITVIISTQGTWNGGPR